MQRKVYFCSAAIPEQARLPVAFRDKIRPKVKEIGVENAKGMKS